MNRPLALQNGAIAELPPGSLLECLCQGEGVELENRTPFTIPYLSPVIVGYGAGAGGMVLAQANSAALCLCVAIVTKDCLPGRTAVAQFAGILEGTAPHWESIAQSPSGLLAGRSYWLSSTTAGKITDSPPTAQGEYLVEIGRALSPTRLFLSPQFPIGL